MGVVDEGAHASPRDKNYRRRAKTLYERPGTLEVTDHAAVSVPVAPPGGRRGAWVEAWLWVEDDEGSHGQHDLLPPRDRPGD